MNIQDKKASEYISKCIADMAQKLIEMGIPENDISYCFSLVQYDEKTDGLDSLCLVSLGDDEDADALITMTETSISQVVNEYRDSKKIEDSLGDEASNIEYWINKAKEN